MKVIITCPRTPRLYNAGLENLSLKTAKYLIKSGVEVEIYTTAPEPKHNTFQGISIKEFKAWAPNESYFFSPRLFFEIKKSDADIILVNGYNNLVSLFAILGKKPKQKLTFNLCSSGPNSILNKFLRKIYDFIIKVFSKKIDFVIYHGLGEKEIYRNIFKTVPSKIIYVGYDPKEIQKSRSKPEKNRLICTARIVKNKGYSNLIPSFALVVEKNPKAKLVIVGDGSDRDKIVTLVKSLNIEKNVLFKGDLKRNEYIKELEKASASILLLEFKNASTVLIEALKMGLPCIITSNSVPEFVEKKFVVGVPDPKNHEAVANTILNVLKKPQSYILNNPEILSWEQIVDEELKIFKKFSDKAI